LLFDSGILEFARLMKHISPVIVVCALFGVLLGYGLTTAATNATLGSVAESAETLELAPVSQPAQNFNHGGGSCG